MIPMPAKPTSMRRVSFKLGARNGLSSATPQCILVAAAGLAALLVTTSYSLVPFISGTPRSLLRAGYREESIQGSSRGLKALRQIESLFPKEVASMMRRKASEDQLSMDDQDPSILSLERVIERRRKAQSLPTEDPLPKDVPAAALSTADGHNYLAKAAAEGEDVQIVEKMTKILQPDPHDPLRIARRVQRTERQTNRMHELIDSYKAGVVEDAQKTRDNSLIQQVVRNSEGSQQSFASGGQGTPIPGTQAQTLQQLTALNASLGTVHAMPQVRPSLFREGQDQMVRLMKDQLIMARAYSAIALQNGNSRLAKDIKARIKDLLKALGDAEMDTDLPHNAVDKMRAMGQVLSKAKEKHFDCTSLVKKLRAMVHATDDQNLALRRQGLFLSQVAARTVPKGLFCLSMRLTIDFWAMTPEQQELPHKERLEDRDFHHYALFSDNVLASSVVVNSTITNCKNSSEHVIHVVTDKLNYGAMKAWFILHPPRDAAIEVLNIDDFKWLNSSYCPVLKQLESSAMKQFYFKVQQTDDKGSSDGDASNANLKYRNPKYLNMLNHLRFYLPEVFPKLDKILFLDDDIVVQQDLTGLWEEDMRGMVNGAVETCGTSFHRFDKYLNFSNPLISSNFDSQACGWAYGMNMFDLDQWKTKDITGIYHHWQTLNEDRTLWKLGTLPPGLITFYNLTHSLPKHWHFLGLGYNPNLDMAELEKAAVVHYNGNMKPWLEIGMTKFKGYWSKYVDYGSSFLQQCNINP